MQVHIEHQYIVPAPKSRVLDAFVGTPYRWLPDPGRPAGPNRWRVDLHAGPAHHEAIVEVGSAGPIPNGTRRSISWWAPTESGLVTEHSGLFPHFQGHVTLTHEDDGEAITIAGDYQPPGGLAGAAVDLAAGRRVAHATVKWMAEGVAKGLADLASVDA